MTPINGTHAGPCTLPVGVQWIHAWLQIHKEEANSAYSGAQAAVLLPQNVCTY